MEATSIIKLRPGVVGHPRPSVRVQALDSQLVEGGIAQKNVFYNGWRNTTGINWQHLYSSRAFSVASFSNSEQEQTINETGQMHGAVGAELLKWALDGESRAANAELRTHVMTHRTLRTMERKDYAGH